MIALLGVALVWGILVGVVTAPLVTRLRQTVQNRRLVTIEIREPGGMYRRYRFRPSDVVKFKNDGMGVKMTYHNCPILEGESK